MNYDERKLKDGHCMLNNDEKRNIEIMMKKEISKDGVLLLNN